MRRVLGPIFAAIVAVVIANAHGCAPRASSTAGANAAYTAETLGCVEKAKSKEDSHKCRVEVNRRYGLCGELGPGQKRSVPCE